MKRDMVLIKAMLQFLRDRDETSMIRMIPIEDRSEAEIKYHQVLLAQAGFVEFEPVKSKTSDRIIEAYVFNLTWEGHEFLSAIGNETVWRKLRGQFGTEFSGLPIKVASDLANHIVKEWAKELLGW